MCVVMDGGEVSLRFNTSPVYNAARPSGKSFFSTGSDGPKLTDEENEVCLT